MIFQIRLAKGLSRQKTRQERNRQEKKRMVSAFFIVFFMGFMSETVAQDAKNQNAKKMLCTVGRGKENDNIGGKYEIQTRGRETAVSILESGRPLAGYRVTPDTSGTQGRYQLSADLDGVEFIQNDLRDISVAEGGEPGSGEQAAIIIGMPIAQYQSSSSSSSYLLPIFTPGDFVPENNVYAASWGFVSLDVRMLAYHSDRRERQWVQAHMLIWNNLLSSVRITDPSVRIDEDSRYLPGSRISIDLFSVEGINNIDRTFVRFYYHLLAEWFIQAVREREPSHRVTFSGQPLDAPTTFRVPSLPEMPTSETYFNLPSAISAFSPSSEP